MSARMSTVAGWILAVIAVATLSFGIRDRDWAWVASGLLVLCLGSDVTADPVNAWRAAGMLPVLWAFGTNYRAADEPFSAETPTSVVASPT